MARAVLLCCGHVMHKRSVVSKIGIALGFDHETDFFKWHIDGEQLSVEGAAL